MRRGSEPTRDDKSRTRRRSRTSSTSSSGRESSGEVVVLRRARRDAQAPLRPRSGSHRERPAAIGSTGRRDLRHSVSRRASRDGSTEEQAKTVVLRRRPARCTRCHGISKAAKR
ncbi:hypothetical protein MTO96_038027 [Rhipicephalus appendiculatus]